MTDRKRALAAPGTSGHTRQTEDLPVVNRRKRVGVVYSTNPEYDYVQEEEEETVQTLPKSRQCLRLALERAGRGGKTVTLVKGFVGTHRDLEQLCRLLKQKCGVGGSAKDGLILIQGDHRVRLLEILKSEGYTRTR